MGSGSTNEKPTHEGEARTPSGSLIYEGDNYKDAIDDFEEHGFTNIKTETTDDLILGWLKKDGDVESISVDSDIDYSPGVWYPNDVEVIIIYHTFSSTDSEDDINKDEKIDDNTIEEPETTEEGITNLENESAQEVQNDAKDDDSTDLNEAGSNSSETKVDAEPEILTIENNDDLAKLLYVKSTHDPFISEFAKKYRGKTIQFDANIAYMMKHDDFKTRYDLLIYVDDYSETSAIGPAFMFEDINIVFDLKLTGDNIPDYIGTGLNVEITAKVLNYNEINDLFYLKPISTKIR